MRINVDIDGILCHNSDSKDYLHAVPLLDNIARINKLAESNTIFLYTSRKPKDREVTIFWLVRHKVKFDSIRFGKPPSDLYIDDKAINFIPELGNTSLNRKPIALCYSGGMDSYLAYQYAVIEYGYSPEDIVCIYFDLGHPYRDKELNALKELGIPYKKFVLNLIQEELANVPTIDNYIIPGRNMIMASIAGGFGELVWLVGIKFEDHYLMYDKNTNFYRTASLALSQSLGTETTVESPFVSWTKTDMVEWAKKNNLLAGLDKTVSCYHPTKKRCGECGLCFKRWVATSMAGVTEEYDVNPWESDVGKDFVKKYKEAWRKEDYTHYSKERIEETLTAVRLAKGD